MNYRRFGDSGFDVSEIGFGAWGIGGVQKDSMAYGPTDDRLSRKALRRAIDFGVTFFDTSPLYGYGHSEKLIGSTLKDVRHKIIIASKVGYVDFTGKQNFSPSYIRKSVELSLARLKTDVIDVFQLHDPPLDLLLKDFRIIETLNSLKKEGKIRVIGLSSEVSENILLAIEQLPIKSIQVNFSLVDQRPLACDFFEKCKRHGIAVIARTPLCFGFLTGRYAASQNYDPADHRSMWSKEQISQWAKAYELFTSEMTEGDQTNAQIALRFCLSYTGISTTIPGMLNEEQVEENTCSSGLGPFSGLELAKFNQIYKDNAFFIKK